VVWHKNLRLKTKLDEQKLTKRSMISSFRLTSWLKLISRLKERLEVVAIVSLAVNVTVKANSNQVHWAMHLDATDVPTLGSQPLSLVKKYEF